MNEPTPGAETPEQAPGVSHLVICPICLREVPGWYDPDADEDNPYRHLRRDVEATQRQRAGGARGAPVRVACPDEDAPRPCPERPPRRG
ncbi:MAG: hypothetical protein ACRDMV_10875 [Streptosporangiales bacterium]